MTDTYDTISQLVSIMAFVLLFVIGFGYLITGGDAVSFEEVVIVMLINIGTVALE